MAGLIRKIFRVCILAIVAPAVAFGAQSPRVANSKVLTRNQSSDRNVAIRRSATSVIARSTNANARRSGKIVTARPAVARSFSNVSAHSGTRVVSSGSNLSRAAVSKSGTVRSATNQNRQNPNPSHMSRAASSRATAVFNDVTKIGSEYASCRDAYATCMDQFCAVANDTYRRCFCSDKFSNLRDTSDNIDQALGILLSFQNENLDAVNKTAAEVNAMYTATAGENAIKKDTSASQKMLDEIGDILSGKKSKTNNNSSISTGILDFGDLSDIGDVWSSNSSTIFNSRNVDSMSGLEGYALYKRAASQCADLVEEICSGDSVFNLASSAYSIMVTQDCNILEKSINAKKENVMKTVKQAEKLLREARLEEYRAHNSQDVNECLTRVEMALLSPVACGNNYEKCLDYTGLYIDSNTGNPISHQLFNLTNISPELGDIDVIKANPRWDEFLEGKKMFATTALDTCRSLADTVWTEYKRSAMIRIAQMQDAKIEEFKNSCVQTIKECYNTNDETLNDMTSDVLTNTTYDVSASRAIAVRNMCYQDVMACAAMYGDENGCEYNSRTRKITARENAECGLKALLAYVDTVDSARVAQGCEAALVAKAHDMCDPLDTTTSSSTSSSSRAAVLLGRARDTTFTSSQINFKSKDVMKGQAEQAVKTAQNTVMCGKGYFLPRGSKECSLCNGYSIKENMYCPGGVFITNFSEDQGIYVCSGNKIANEDHTGCVSRSSGSAQAEEESTTTKYPAGCKSWKLQKVHSELYNHANDFCSVDLAEDDRANINKKDESALNIQIVKDTIFNVFLRLCLDLGYSNATCEKYRNERPQTSATESSTPVSSATSSSSNSKGNTAPITKANESYQENVNANKGAGYDKGGTPATVIAIDEGMTLKDKMEMYLAAGQDIISPVGNVVDDFGMKRDSIVFDSSQSSMPQSENIQQQGIIQGSYDSAVIPSTGMGQQFQSGALY